MSTKHPDSQEAETSLNRVRIHHFHAYNRVRLTVYTLPFKIHQGPNQTIYAVGMALCSKKDNGNRLEGRELAKVSAEIARRDFPSFETNPDLSFMHKLLEPGVAIFTFAHRLKLLISSLRSVERHCTDCKALAIYNQVFRGNFNYPYIIEPQNEDR